MFFAHIPETIFYLLKVYTKEVKTVPTKFVLFLCGTPKNVTLIHCCLLLCFCPVFSDTGSKKVFCPASTGGLA